MTVNGNPEMKGRTKPALPLPKPQPPKAELGALPMPGSRDRLLDSAAGRLQIKGRVRHAVRRGLELMNGGYRRLLRPPERRHCRSPPYAHIIAANGHGGSMINPGRTAEIVGGKAVVGGDIRSGLDLVQAVRRGLPVGAAQHVLDSGRLTPAEMDKVVLPRKTLANRRKVGTLTAEQSDRLLRVARVLAAADETFGNPEKAGTWLRRPTLALAGERPLDLLDTDEGAREVEILLGRIGHGIAA